MTLYGELGVKEGASYDEIRAAYLRLAKTHHPDHVHDGDRDSADQQMSRLNYIIGVLGDAEERAAYDAELGRQRADIRAREALALQALEAARHGRRTPGSRIRTAIFAAVGVALAGVATVILLVGDFGEAPARQRTAAKPDPGASRKNASEPSGSIEASNPPVKINPSPLSHNGVPESLSKPVPDPAYKEAVATPATAPRNSTPQLPQISAADARRQAILAEARKALESPPAAPREIRGNDVPRPSADPALVRPEPARLAAKEPPPPPVSVASAVPPAPTKTPPTPQKSDPVQHWKGLWRYKADPRNLPIAQFSALDVEMRLQNVDSRVYGTYKAIYSEKEAYLGDVDLLLSVMSIGEDWLRGVWSGNRGAYGQFELKKTPRGVEMNWWTTKAGRTSSRSSGSVLLTENHR